MDENNKPKTNFSFPNSDRPLGSTEETAGPIDQNKEHETVKFRDIIANQESKFINNDSGVPQIETYNSDVARAIKKDSVSALQIALAEQKKQQDRQASGDSLDQQKSKGLMIKIVFIALFSIIILFGYLWWAGYIGKGNQAIQNNINVNQSINQAVSPVKIEQKQILLVDNKDSISIKNDINKAKNGEVESSTIKEIILASQTANGPVRNLSTEEFFAKLDAHVSQSLTRSLDSNYTMGVYGSFPRETFIIFNVKSYDNAFAGMLNWESYLDEDMSDIFDRNIPQTKDVATSSSIVNQRVFTDKIIFNKDTRILNNSAGTSKMLYSFIDPKTLVIVSSETGLREIISRLTTGKITR